MPVCACYLVLKVLSFLPSGLTVLWVKPFAVVSSDSWALTYSGPSPHYLANRPNSNSLTALSLLSWLQLPRLSSGNLEQLQKSFSG